MEARTLGNFIAALRKANGMTQKELAERLNVSDKTVSRWEREEGAPDLSLIPVIAEIFGVTCDELLRGERKPVDQQKTPPQEPAEPTAKAEKTLKRIVREAVMNHRTRSMVALGIAGAGLIAGLMANSFNRANLGFWLCWAFQLIAAVCEGVFQNRALFTISAEELSQEEVWMAKRSMIALASRCFGVMFAIAMAALPMLLLVPNAYYGIAEDVWLLLAAMLGAAARFIWLIVNDELMARLMQRGVIRMSDKESAVFSRNRALKRHLTLGVICALTATAAAQGFASNFFSAYEIARPIVFNDYESFQEYMETETWRFEANSIAAEPVDVVDEDAYSRQLTLEDGTVVLSYRHLNGEVMRVSCSEHDGSLLPISVLTHAAVDAAKNLVALRNAAFCAAYVLELLTAVVVYRLRRAK